MLGAIVGDIVGSIYEFDNHGSKSFSLFSPESVFTDDSVMTCALARLDQPLRDVVRLFRGRFCA